MNKRYIDIHKHLPEQEIGSYLEIQNITEAENFVFRNTWESLAKIQLNRFILTADEVGISKFENMMNIEPLGSLEDRRKLVFYIWNRRIIYTVRTVEDMLDDLIGKDKYFLDLRASRFGVKLTVYAERGEGLDEGVISNTLRQAIPANLTMQIWVKFVDHEDIYLATYSQVLRHIKHNIPEPTTQYEKYNRFAVYPRSAKYIKTMIDVVPIQHTNSKINTFTATQIGKEIKFETFKAYSTSLYIQDMLSNTLYEFKE